MSQTQIKYYQGSHRNWAKKIKLLFHNFSMTNLYVPRDCGATLRLGGHISDSIWGRGGGHKTLFLTNSLGGHKTLFLTNSLKS